MLVASTTASSPSFEQQPELQIQQLRRRRRQPVVFVVALAAAAAPLPIASLSVVQRPAQGSALQREVIHKPGALASLAAASSSSSSLEVAPSSGKEPVAYPSPYVIWVEDPIVPTTTPPLFEQCYGCGCLVANMDPFVKTGVLNAKYICAGGGAAGEGGLIPEMTWTGPTGGPQDMSKQTYAITVVDLDFPYGDGSGRNSVEPLFWAVNIPGDWRDFSAAKLAEDDEGIVMGLLSAGADGQRKAGMMPVCPLRGKHRIKTTIWALRDALNGVGPGSPYHDVMAEIEASELARQTAFADVSARR